MLRRRESALLSRHLSDAMRSIGRSLAQAGFRIACLPHEATVSAAAVLRTAVRMLITRRHLLEWSAYDDRQTAPDLLGSIRSMWSATFFAGLAAVGLAAWKPGALPAALPVLVLWLAAPVLTWWLSRPLVRRAAELTREQAVFLRRIARKTWAYFEQFVVEEDHWLPPDNFQEQPGPVIAHRTSPTNIGIAQLASLAASDFGYISVGALIQRTSNAFRAMASLERHQGHFYNWYDTQTLRPLRSRYISSVDSGNLAAHLLTACRPARLPDQRIFSARFRGPADTLGLLPDVREPDQEAVRGLRSLLYAVWNRRAPDCPQSGNNSQPSRRDCGPRYRMDRPARR